MTVQINDPQEAKNLLGDGCPRTAGYQSGVGGMWFKTPRDLPPLTFVTIQAMLLDPTIRLGLAIRSAVIQAAEFAYKDPGGEWKEGVRAESPIVAAFVYRQMQKIWNHNLDSLLHSQIWGWAGAEVTYKLTPWGTVEIDRLWPAHARDVQALSNEENDVAGVRFLRIQDRKTRVASGTVDLLKPKALWHPFCSEARRPYGFTILYGPYSPWADKWLNGGALDVRRLFMKKDAYGGVDISYPDRSYTMPDGSTQYARDIARQIAEQLQAGGVTTRPSHYDENGKELFTITRATVPASPQHILQYPKDLDVEMLRGLEIPDDILTSEQSGAWAGKQVPMMAFYQGLERWLRGMVADCVEIVQYLVEINFGNAWFEVTTKPLAKQAQDQQQQAEKPEGGQNQGEQRPAVMGQQEQQPRQEQTPGVQKMSLVEGTCCEPQSIAVTVEDVVRRARKAIAERIKPEQPEHVHA